VLISILKTCKKIIAKIIGREVPDPNLAEVIIFPINSLQVFDMLINTIIKIDN